MTVKVIDTSAGGCLILILPIAFLIIFLFTTWPVLLALLVLAVSWNIWQRYQWQKWSQQVNPTFHRLIQENRGSITALDLAMKASLPAATAKRYLDIKAEEFGAQRLDDEDQGTVYYFITARTLGSIFDDSEPSSPPRRKDETDSLLLSENQNQLLQPEDSVDRGSLQEEREFAQPGEHGVPSGDEGRPPHATPSSTSTGVQGKNQSPPDTHPHLPPTSGIPAPSEASAEGSKPTNHKQSAFESLLQSELAKRLDVHSSTVYKRRSDPDFPEWSRSRDPEGIAWKYSPDTKQFSPLEPEPQ
jgi:hypothetical protein